MAKIYDFISSHYEKVLSKTVKLSLSARDVKKIRTCINKLSEIERVAAEYRELLQFRLDYTKRNDQE